MPWALVAGTSLAAGCSNPPQSGSGTDPPWPVMWSGDGGAPSGWALAWSDEFDQPDGADADPTKWSHDVGNGSQGWGNQEREYYTPGTMNTVTMGGSLVISATRQGASSYSCWYGTCQYTSGRINTQVAFSQAYGRFEARMQIPQGAGLWPAFWLLGADVVEDGWPQCGEIDIMENSGDTPQINHGSLHIAGPGGAAATLTDLYEASGSQSLADGFHTYAIDWTPDAIWFYVDDDLYETQTREGAASESDSWPFDSPFFIIVNLAVGGNFTGDPSQTALPQSLKVDWVRVYKQTGGGG
jgi:beta-glucanase (GH16 family)